MADSTWEWVKGKRNYRSTTSGRFIARATILQLRDDFLADRKKAIADLTDRLVAGETTVAEWLTGMRDLVREVTLGEYTFGRGGRNAMGDDDLSAVGEVVRAQYDYLQAFAEAVRAGELTARQIGARGALYASAARQAFERGKAAAWGVELPHHPGDGSTQCLSNCKCYTIITETGDEWRVTWNTTSGETCSDCSARAREWSPLVIPKEAA